MGITIIEPCRTLVEVRGTRPFKNIAWWTWHVTSFTHIRRHYYCESFLCLFSFSPVPFLFLLLQPPVPTERNHKLYIVINMTYATRQSQKVQICGLKPFFCTWWISNSSFPADQLQILQCRKLALFFLCFSSAASFIVLQVIFQVKETETSCTLITWGGWQQYSFHAENDIYFFWR